MPNQPIDSYPLGAHLLSGGRCSFKVWAPAARGIALEVEPRVGDQSRRRIELHPHRGVMGAVVDGVMDGDRYNYVFPDGQKRPDPRSRRQPEGVHGPAGLARLVRAAHDVGLAVDERGLGDIGTLLRSGETWTVD